MPTSSISSQSKVWAVSKMEKADGTLFYQSPLSVYDTSNISRSQWEKLRFKYCLLCKHDNISEQYRTGLPIPKNLAIANITLLSKIILKEGSKWLKGQF